MTAVGTQRLRLPALRAGEEQPWRATGLETPIFADPSGRRARGMSGVGLALVAATLAALVIVVTAAVGFSSLPVRVPAPSALASGPHAPGHRFTALAHVRGLHRLDRDPDTTRVLARPDHLSSQRRD